MRSKLWFGPKAFVSSVMNDTRPFDGLGASGYTRTVLFYPWSWCLAREDLQNQVKGLKDSSNPRPTVKIAEHRIVAVRLLWEQIVPVPCPPTGGDSGRN